MRSKLAKKQEINLSAAKATECQETERAILLEIIKLQMLLNSKMFEFIRNYQKESNYNDEAIFRTTGGGSSHIIRINKEINEIGCELATLIQKLTNGNIFGKRDEKGRILAYCNVCKKETAFASVISAPYGMPGAYMAGSERLMCCSCKKDEIYPDDGRLPKYNCFFSLE